MKKNCEFENRKRKTTLADSAFEKPKAVGQFKNEACLPSGSYSVFWLYLFGSLFSSSPSFYAKFFFCMFEELLRNRDEWWRVGTNTKQTSFCSKIQKKIWSFTQPRHSSVWPKWRLCHCRCFTCLQAFLTVLSKPRKLGCFVTVKKLFVFHNHVFCHHHFLVLHSFVIG